MKKREIILTFCILLLVILTYAEYLTLTGKFQEKDIIEEETTLDSPEKEPSPEPTSESPVDKEEPEEVLSSPEEIISESPNQTINQQQNQTFRNKRNATNTTNNITKEKKSKITEEFLAFYEKFLNLFFKPILSPANEIIASHSPDYVIYDSDTNNIDLTVTTYAIATCKYDTTSGTNFEDMPFLFIDNGLTHTKSLNNLINGRTYHFYIKCKTELGNVNSDDYVVTYRILSSTNDQFPKIALVIHPCVNTEEDLEKLSKYDLIVLHKYYTQTTGTCNQGLLSDIRQKNPDIKILVHIPQSYLEYISGSIPESYYLFPLLNGVKVTGDPSDLWILTDANGDPYIIQQDGWQETIADITPYCPDSWCWNEQNVNYTKEEIISSGVWDGVFWDSLYNDIYWINHEDWSMDIDHNGIADTYTFVINQWTQGVNNFYNLARQETGYDTIMIGNGYHDQYSYGNGLMIEDFSWKSWDFQMDVINDWEQSSIEPNYNIIVAQINPSDTYQYRRYVFGSTLLTNAYFEIADHAYSNYWWLDEYAVDYLSGQAVTPTSSNNYAGKYYLGESLNEAYYQNSVWRRDFEKGIVLVNPSTSSKTITLEKEYRKILGTQDSTTNNGLAVSQITLKANDSIILLNQLSCGDNFCTTNETCETCSNDCGICEQPTTGTGNPGSGSGNGGSSNENLNTNIKNNDTSCYDECSIGQKECLSKTTYRTCLNYDPDSCLEWSYKKECSESYRCKYGECVFISKTEPKEIIKAIVTTKQLAFPAVIVCLLYASTIYLVIRLVKRHRLR